MVVKKLRINNYRIFQGEHEIIFPESGKPAVFVGVNGAGKTTIIEAIIGCLWEFYHKIQGKKLLKEERFRKSNVNVYADEFAKVDLEWGNIEELNLITGFEIRKTLEPEYKFSGSKKIEEYIEVLKGDVGYFKQSSSVPVLVYYPVERTVLDPSLENKDIEKGNQFDAYQNAFEKSVNFNQFFEWFRSTEDQENEIRLHKNSTYSDKGLDAVRKAILFFLDKFTKIRVKRGGQTSLVLEKLDKEYEVNQLSHGEKAIIAMVGDLARRLVMANPGGKNPLKGEGIVMIDELDLHLHPTWQKSILYNLRKTFPSIQFICTTHSSLVINHLEKESIYLLEDGMCAPLSEKFTDFNSYGADIEDVLKIVQGTEILIPKEIQTQFNDLYKYLDDGEIEKAKKVIENLKRMTDPNQPELKKAETQIKYKEMLRK